MVFHMKKTTLVLPDPLFRELKKRSAELGETMSSLVTEFVRRGLSQKPAPGELHPLPAFRMGEPRIDVSDREELFRLFDREDSRAVADTEDA